MAKIQPHAKMPISTINRPVSGAHHAKCVFVYTCEKKISAPEIHHLNHALKGFFKEKKQ